MIASWKWQLIAIEIKAPSDTRPESRREKRGESRRSQSISTLKRTPHLAESSQLSVSLFSRTETRCEAMMEAGPSNGKEVASKTGNHETLADYIARFRRASRNFQSHDDVASLLIELQRAYATAELHHQLEEKRYRLHEEHTREYERIKSERQRQMRKAIEEGHWHCLELRRRAEEYRDLLDEQVARKEENRKAQAEEAREYLKTLVEADREQDERERTTILKKKDELAKKVKREKLILEEMKEIHLEKEREAEKRKLREDLKYLKELDERSEEMSKLRREQVERRDRVLLEATSMLLDVEARKREREERLFQLVAEEIKCELMMRERELALRRKRMQQDLAASLEEQMVLAEQRKQRFAEEDRTWAEDVIKRIMEDEKVARYTAEARRRMRMQYREELEDLIAYRRRIREQEIAKLEESAKEEEKLRRLEAERTREERKRLLAEHAPNIANFVNKTLLTVEERRILDELTRESRETGNDDDHAMNILEGSKVKLNEDCRADNTRESTRTQSE